MGRRLLPAAMASSERAPLSAALDLDEVSNVLLLVSPLEADDLDGCMDLLTVDAPARENVWSLGITVSPNTRVKNWEERVGEKPAAFRVVSVGRLPHTTARETARSYGFDPEPHFVSVSDGGNLTRIGAEFTSALGEWADSGRRTVVCFHSVSALLQYASEKRAFQFLNTFTRHVEEEGALAHYHLDPEAHAPATVARFSSIVDVVCSVDGDGEWEVAAP